MNLKHIKYVSFIVLVATLLMSVGYAAINPINLEVNGLASATSQEGIYITNFVYEGSSGVASEESKIISVSGQTIKSEIVLSPTEESSYITYKITVYNNTHLNYKFKDVIYEDDFYSNDDIIFELSSNTNEDILYSGDDITFNITFKYAPGITPSISNNKLTSYLKFEFKYIELLLSGSDPVFNDEGLIPVVISNDGSVKTADVDSAWYSYENKNWANAVLVKQNGIESRTYYMENDNVTVNNSDILAYYVWIPRFSYTFYKGTDGNNGYAGGTQSAPGTINIKFVGSDVTESGTATYTSSASGVNVSGYYTHPAFNFKENISGFWMGKFDTTKGTSDNVGTDNPTILPNSSSWVNQNVSSQFTTILKFASGSLSSGNISFSGSDLYGLSNKVDSHMMKNNEWGAVSYLSHSIYGINGQIRINNYYNNSTYKTGCGSNNDDSGASTTCDIVYGEAASYPQSSTGNISGVFDMAGGAYDRVMGNFSSKTGNSGFGTYPPSVYYDNYTVVIGGCNLTNCGGHSLYETQGWYSDLVNLVNSNYPWMVRGGSYEVGSEAGAFNFGRNNGSATGKSTARATLILYD